MNGPRARWPWPFLLLLVGALAATARLLPGIALSPQLVLFVFLPPLLFDAAFSMRAAAVRRELGWIVALGVAGAVAAAGLAYALLRLLGFGRDEALLLSAALAATDPISVFAAFRVQRAPERLRVVLEGESLANDGVAVVLFAVAAGLAQGATEGVPAAVGEFVRLSAGGLALGGLLGIAASRLLRRAGSAGGIALSVLVAFAAYAVAERLGFSGLLSVIIAALILGNTVGLHALRGIHRFWRSTGFAVSILVFLLMGLQVRLDELAGVIPRLVELLLAVLLARTVMVGPVTGWSRAAWPLRWQVALVWTGLRGALSLALALSAPPLPARREILLLAFGYVFLSLSVQGLSVGPVFRSLGVSKPASPAPGL